VTFDISNVALLDFITMQLVSQKKEGRRRKKLKKEGRRRKKLISYYIQKTCL
jgi:hypothetical protein